MRLIAGNVGAGVAAGNAAAVGVADTSAVAAASDLLKIPDKKLILDYDKCFEVFPKLETKILHDDCVQCKEYMFSNYKYKLSEWNFFFCQKISICRK